MFYNTLINYSLFTIIEFFTYISILLLCLFILLVYLWILSFSCSLLLNSVFDYSDFVEVLLLFLIIAWMVFISLFLYLVPELPCSLFNYSIYISGIQWLWLVNSFGFSLFYGFYLFIIDLIFIHPLCFSAAFNTFSILSLGLFILCSVYFVILFINCMSSCRTSFYSYFMVLSLFLYVYFNSFLLKLIFYVVDEFPYSFIFNWLSIFLILVWLLFISDSFNSLYFCSYYLRTLSIVVVVILFFGLILILALFIQGTIYFIFCSNFYLFQCCEYSLIIPSGVLVVFFVSSIDIVHSFGVSCLGISIDCIPGRINFVFEVINLNGLIRGFCYEFCGQYHSTMVIIGLCLIIVYSF